MKLSPLAISAILSIVTPGGASPMDDASSRPSSLHARLVTTKLRSGVSVKSSRPLAASLILIERDTAAEASRLPSRKVSNDFGGTGNERGSLVAFTSQSLTLTPG